MSDIAISVRGVSKKYIIGKQKDGSLRGTLGSLFSKKSATSDEFWALKDVSFDIQRGDVVGIIGKNGAGKSTILKILSQITRPTEGEIEINGRIASLLEVGTGFHPELTGRENIYLNGTILGMTRKEVAAKFDEIVAFSGVEKFIDTPVKHYSSGMYVRLAFAVAAHLEPEILIIDEVLAVGDAEFQKKCLGKMKDVAGEGRTVIFVSHDLGAVKQLCNKGVLLKHGEIEYIGEINTVIERYAIQNISNELTNDCSNFIDRPRGNKFAALTFLEINDNLFSPKDTLKISCHFKCLNDILIGKVAEVAIFIFDEFKTCIYHCKSTVHNTILFENRLQKVQFEILDLYLGKGTYTIGVHLSSEIGECDYVEDAFSIEVSNEPVDEKFGLFVGKVHKKINFNVFS